MESEHVFILYYTEELLEITCNHGDHLWSRRL
jgi:hypothetical protein